MPTRHHRTVDRVVAILETAAQSARGVTLAELADSLSAAKSSVQELTNGLLATGYLVEHDKRFMLGPGPFVLARRSLPDAARRVDHLELERVQRRLGVPTFVGVRLGDDQVFVDQAGEDVLMDFVSSKHPRRPLLTTATGKILLAFAPTSERNAFLRAAERDRSELVAAFLAELPQIRAGSLAFNEGASLPGRFAVATPLFDPAGTFLAAICAVTGPQRAEELRQIGQSLLDAVTGWHFPNVPV
jgi:DNA-binding IclR family transcriptional regulator